MFNHKDHILEMLHKLLVIDSSVSVHICEKIQSNALLSFKVKIGKFGETFVVLRPL